MEKMKMILDIMNHDKVLWVPVGFVVLVVAVLLTVVPSSTIGYNERVDLCHSKGGVLIKGGTCIDKDSVIRLNP